MEPKPEPETAKEEPEENIYENIYENIQPEPKSSKETDLGDGSPKKRPRKRASVSKGNWHIEQFLAKQQV